MISLVEYHLPELKALCKEHQVESLSLFGSASTGAFHDKSDIDLLVSFSTNVKLLDYADNYFTLLERLKILFNREVDLVSEKTIKNPVLRQEINHSRVKIL